MEDITFSNVSPGAFEQISTLVTGVLEGTHREAGLVEFQGVTCRYRFDATQKTLAVSVLGTPRLVTQGYVVGWLHDALRRHAAKPVTVTPGGV